WVNHVRTAVRLLDGMRTLEAEGASTFLELGPGGMLCAMGYGCLSAEAQTGAAFLPAFRNDCSELDTPTAALGGLHARGHQLDWKAFYAPFKARCAPLPTYAFQRGRYWVEATDFRNTQNPSNASRGSALAVPDSPSASSEASFWETVERGDVDSLTAKLS